MRWHLDIRHQSAINTKPDAGFELARHRFNVNVRGILAVGVDDHLVDELDQFIVGRRRLQRIVIAAVIDGRAIQVGQ